MGKQRDWASPTPTHLCPLLSSGEGWALRTHIDVRGRECGGLNHHFLSTFCVLVICYSFPLVILTPIAAHEPISNINVIVDLY